MIYLRQSTASQEVPLGTFLDDTDGKTAETGLAIANTDIKLWKSGATSEASKNSGGATHIASGRYYAVMDATDSDTIGPMEVNVAVSGALPVKVRCLVLHANVFDVLFGSVAPSTHTAAAVQSLVAAGAVASVTGAVGSVTGNVGGNVVGSVASVTGNVGGNVTGSVGSVTAPVTAGTVSDKTGYSVSGTTTTLDALQTALNSAHGAGSWATATGFSTLDASGIRTAIGLASANLDTQLGTLATTGDIPSAATIASAVRDVDNTTPAASSLGAGVNASASGGLDPQDVADLVIAGLGTVDANIVSYAAGQDPATLLDARFDAVDGAVAGLNNLDATAVQTAAAAALTAYDGPTNAEMDARTLPTASYATAAALTAVDTVVDAILLDTGTNGVVVAAGSKTGYSLASTGLDAIIPAEPSSAPAWGASIVSWLAWLGLLGRNKQTRTAGTAAVRNDADNATIATASLSDDGTTFTRGEWS